MSGSESGTYLDIVRCLALFLRDQRDAIEIISAAVRTIDDRLPRGVVRIWISRSTKQCSSCPSPHVCDAEFNCLQLEASAGESVSHQDKMANLPIGEFMPGIVGKSSQDHFCADLRGLGKKAERDWAKAFDLNAFCGFPLRSAGRKLGVLGIYLEELPSEEARRNLSCVAMLLSQALGSAFLRCEQQRLSFDLEKKVEQRTSELGTRVVDLEDSRRALLNMMSEAFESQRQMRQLTEKLEVMVEDRTKELLAAKEEAERANRLKSQFLSRVSHEFRTPMHGMVSFASLGIRRIDKLSRDKTLFYFQQILESADELLPLVDDLLDISQIEAGKVEYKFEPIDLKSLVFDIAGKYEPLFAERELEIVVSVADDFPRSVRSDRKHLRQALVNILGNASKFGKPGTEVDVSLALEETDVAIRIADRGPGIPKDELSAIFDSFSQSTVTRGSFEGAGLGLAITRAIVDSHDGRIAVSNREGGGVEFLIRLPWSAEDVEGVIKPPENVVVQEPEEIPLP
ncbi:MAG: signal transduction histidine kinase [Planctomycetota bacterium]|jgi:signal transduction histidine kinase